MTGRTVCSRCQRPLRIKKPPHSATICDGGLALDEQAAATAAATLPRVDDWSVHQRLRELGRELRRPAPASVAAPSGFPQGPRRFDPPQIVVDDVARDTADPFVPTAAYTAIRTAANSRPAKGTQVVAWLVVLAGSLALASGIGLVAWSLVTEQILYWNLALGLTLGGQGVLILGLVLVVLRLWRNSRHATGKLHVVHSQLDKLQHTADALATMRSGGAPAFYAELVRGTSPQVLLANLKGQVDQLATRIGSVS
jgi:hypothetical protein